MKVIFSRKGFDDAYGGSPSPIMPDGKLLSLPIPTKKGEVGYPYVSLSYKGKSYAKIMKELGIKPTSKNCHLDPDLDISVRKKPRGWTSAFGQQGAAAKHLINEGVERDDLFLFFGTFKRTYLDHKNKLRFENDYPRHIIFGYLLIGDIIDLSQNDDKVKANFPWHPHIQNDYGKNNLLFVADKKSEILPRPAGALRYDDKLVLTRNGYRKSIWELPECFHPSQGAKISRHLKKQRFELREGKTIMQTVGIGQDFVVHAKDKRIEQWALNLIGSLS